MTVRRDLRDFFAAMVREYLEGQLTLEEFAKRFVPARLEIDVAYNDGQLSMMVNNIFHTYADYDPDATPETEDAESLSEVTVRGRFMEYLRVLESDDDSWCEFSDL